MFTNHIIPPNISDTGMMLGVSRYRNLAEAGALAFVAVGINIVFFKGLFIPLRIVLLVVMLIPALIAVIGLHDKSLFEYLGDMIRYRTSKGFLPYRLPVPCVVREEKRSRKEDKKEKKEKKRRKSKDGEMQV